MHIKSIVAAAAIALIAGVGSVSADELSVDGTKAAPRTSFAMLDGIATEQMSVQELAATRGAGWHDETINTLSDATSALLSSEARSGATIIVGDLSYSGLTNTGF